jgi:hypothetical protein
MKFLLDAPAPGLACRGIRSPAAKRNPGCVETGEELSWLRPKVAL